MLGLALRTAARAPASKALLARSAARRGAAEKIQVPFEGNFTKNRFTRRPNMQDEDRVKMYNWNLACVILTFIPPLWMSKVTYDSSPETEKIYRALDPTKTQKIRYLPELFY